METQITLPARGYPSFITETQDDASHALYISDFIQWKSTYTKAAYLRYRLWLEKFVEHVRKPPQTITLNDVASFRNSLVGKYAEGSIWQGMVVVRNYLKYLREHNLTRLPTGLLRVPVPYRKPRYTATETEYRKMLGTLTTKSSTAALSRLILQLLHDTGLRSGELRSLNVEDIESDASATVRTEKGNQIRRIYWSETTDRELRAYLAARANQGTAKGALLISSHHRAKDRISPPLVFKVVKRAARMAGLDPRISPHSFRHGFVHRLARQRIPDSIIAVLIGHRSSRTVSQYTKLSRSEYADAFRQTLVSL